MNRRERHETNALAGATRLAVLGATLDEAAQELAFPSGETLRTFLIDHRYVGTARALAENRGLPGEFDALIRPERGEGNDRRRPRHAAS